MKNVQLRPLSLLAGSVATAGLFLLTGMQGTGSFIHGDVREFLSHISMVDLPDGQGGFNRTVRISGINVQVVNGLDATNGYATDPDSLDPLETQTNKLGNLIVGYNELGHPLGDNRTGSHNIVFGHGNSFRSFGGLVGPRDNRITGPFASVTGGDCNWASGAFSSISGGKGNTANGNRSSVSGGHYNAAGGQNSSISGGQGNTARGFRCSISGGRLNTASGVFSSVSGGNNRSATGTDDWLAGSLFEDSRSPMIDLYLKKAFSTVPWRW